VLAFSGRPAGLPVFALLRERAPLPPGSPRRAARASPLRLSGPWDKLGSPVTVPSPRPPWRRSSPRARGAAAGVLPGARPAPRRFALRARGPGSDPPILDLRVPYVHAGRSGPHLRPWTLSCDHPRGGRVSLLVTTPPLGRDGGDVVPSWQLTCWLGADGDGGTWSILSLPRMCSRCNTPIP
jgi:hypothetical protein